MYDLRGKYISHLRCPHQCRYVHELTCYLRQHGLSVHCDAIEPLHILSIGKEEAPTVAPAGHRKALRSLLVLVCLGCLVVVGAEPQALAVHVGEVEGVVGEQVSRLRHTVGHAVGVEHVDATAGVVSLDYHLSDPSLRLL